MRRSRSGRPKVSSRSTPETVARMSGNDTERDEEAIDETGRNLTQQRIDEAGPSAAPVDLDRREVMSEVVPEDEDRGDDGARARSTRTKTSSSPHTGTWYLPLGPVPGTWFDRARGRRAPGTRLRRALPRHAGRRRRDARHRRPGASARARRRRGTPRRPRRVAAPARRDPRAGQLADPLHARGPRDRRVTDLRRGRRRPARRR